MLGTDAVNTAGKQLTFSLEGEVYGLDILRVQEIVGVLPVTRLPRVPDAVAGVLNLRGRVVPVVDLRRALGMTTAEPTERTCIVIALVRRDGAETVMGLVVDEVSEVVDIPADAVTDAPDFGVAVDVSFIRGVARLDERVAILLDIDRVMSGSQLGFIETAAAGIGAEGVQGGRS